MRRSLKKYLADELSQTTKSCPDAFKKFTICRAAIGGPPYEWYLEAALIFFAHRRTVLFEERDEIVTKNTRRKSPIKSAKFR